jgi:hypothetical protein
MSNDPSHRNQQVGAYLTGMWRRVGDLSRQVGVTLIDDALGALGGLRRVLVGAVAVAPASPFAPIPAPTAPTPPGIPLAWDVSMAILDVELRVIDQLDTKAGVVIGALVVAGGLLLNSTGRGVAQALVGLALILALVFATLSFLVRKYEDAPDPTRFASAALFEPNYMKEAFLGNVLGAVDANHERGARKGLYLNCAVGIGALTAVAAVIAKMSGVG